MKIYIAVVLQLYVGITSASSLRVGENLLLNSDFAESSRFWEVEPPAKWEADGVNGTGALFMNAPLAKDDGYIHEVEASQCIKIEDAELFYVEAKFRYDTLPLRAHAHRMNIVWYDNDICTESGQFGNYLEPELRDGVQTLSKSNLRPSLNAGSMKVELTQNQRGSARELTWWEGKWKWLIELLGMHYTQPTASAYWDDVIVSPTRIREQLNAVMEIDSKYNLPPGENYLSNGALDENGEGWRLSSRAMWSDDDGHRNYGSIHTAVKSERGGMGVGVFNQCVNLGNYRNYKMGVMYKKDPQSSQEGGGRFRISWYENENCSGSVRTSSNHADIDKKSEAWQSLEVDGLTRPENAKSASVTMIQSVSGNGTYSGYWDDAYLMAVE